MRFEERSRLRNTKVPGGAASAGTEAAESYPVTFWIMNQGGYTKQIFNVEENLQFRWEKMPPKTFIAREKPAPGFEASEDGLTLMQLVTLS